MSLEKAIEHGKEHRKGYAERGKPGRFDQTCRPGSRNPCPYCQRNRLLGARKLGELIKINDAEGAAAT
jgi:hypothetical protein